MSILITLLGELVILAIVYRLFFSRNEEYRRKIVLSIYFLYLIGVFVVTLGNRTSNDVGDTNLVLFSTLKHMFAPTINLIRQRGLIRGLKALKWIGYPAWASIVLNILMLVPLGYLGPLCFRFLNRWWKIAIIGFNLSLIIEISQLLFQRGWFDIDDILLNTLGSIIGWVLYKQLFTRSIKR